jgi:hypothetical protein
MRTSKESEKNGGGACDDDDVRSESSKKAGSKGCEQQREKWQSRTGQRGIRALG